MKNVVRYIALFMFAFAAVSCVTNRTTRLLQERIGVAKYDSVPRVEYRLQVNDELQLRVVSLNKDITATFNMGQAGAASQNSALSYRIYPDGTIDLPFVDSIPVVGLTLKEAEKVVEEHLKDVGDDISVRLNLANNYFYMIGEAGKGRFPIYKDGTTIYQAIAEARFNPIGNGNLRRVKIIRQHDGNEPTVASFDIRSKSLINSEFYYVQPNDIIYVERSRGSFYKINSFTALTGFITSSLSFFLLMMTYVN